MLVVKKIESLGYFVTIRTVVPTQTKCVICNYKKDIYFDLVDKDKLKATYENIVKFIKWYNKR
jgi:hypothetical protein